MTIAREEIFGPVLATIDFADVEEAIARANDSIYGLAAAVWTRDIKKAHYVARKLQAGTVWVNTYNVYDTAAPFGGYKQSGFGREMGAHALEHYTQVNHHVRGQEGETIAPCWRLSRQPLQHLVALLGRNARSIARSNPSRTQRVAKPCRGFRPLDRPGPGHHLAKRAQGESWGRSPVCSSPQRSARRCRRPWRSAARSSGQPRRAPVACRRPRPRPACRVAAPWPPLPPG